MASIKVFKAPKSISGNTNAPSIISNDNTIKYGYFEELYRLPSSIPIYGSTNLATGAAAAIYTVPNGYTFYLTNFSISSKGNSGIAGAFDIIWFYIDNVIIWQRQIFANTTNYNMTSDNLVFGIPLKLSEKQQLKGSVAIGNANADASYYGFLVKNS